MKDSHPYLLKIVLAFLVILFTATEGLAQLSKKDDRTFRKSEKLFMHDKPNEAIRKSEPVLNRNPAEAKLWMAMIKYHVSRYMNFIDADTTQVKIRNPFHQ
jgi:hypothetical protein